MSNWGFMADGQHGTVFPTDDPVDGEEVFATFTEARKELSDWFLFVADEPVGPNVGYFNPQFVGSF